MKNETDNDLVHPIRRLREKYSLSQAKFGAILDVSGNFVAQIETGNAQLSKRILSEICRKFNLDTDRFKGELKDYRETQKKQLLERISGD